MVLRHWVTRTFSGRALALGALLKLVAVLVRLAASPSVAVQVVDAAGTLCLVAGAVTLAYRLFVDVKRVLLWRVRRKLTLSYIFIGFVPALLIILFFLVCGLLLFFNIGSYMMRDGIQALADQMHAIAELTAIELQQAGSEAEARDAFARRYAAASARYPQVSFAVVPVGRTCDRAPETPASAAPTRLTAGPWTYLDAPELIPDWVPCSGRAGPLAYRENPDEFTHLAVRGIAMPESRRPRFAVVVDLPLNESMNRELYAATGIRIGAMDPVEDARQGVVPVAGRPSDTTSSQVPRAITAGPAQIVIGDELRSSELQWVTLLDYLDWDSGRLGTVAVNFRMSPLDIYRRVSAASLTRISNLDFGQILLILLAVVGGLFFVILAVAFVMGLALARSITGSVHELFVGTERVRRGDFTHKVRIRSRDQLGELAESFNSMTASIEDLLQQKAEKERLEQELRIARAIQMSLLPADGLALAGLSLIAHCEPAREVGGDYYDYLPIDDHRVGLLIADVSGKGTSAALYMAVLKGIVLSLSQLHTSPRRLLMDANRIIARHLDTKSFITVTYAVIDLERRTLTHARAGHCPLIHVPGPHAASRAAQVLAPDGLVLGLQIDNGETFDRLLEETTLPLGVGDVVMLYTDGITETMNTAGDFFGEVRLGSLLQHHANLPFDQLRETILREVRGFAGTAAQQDDMTMLLLKID